MFAATFFELTALFALGPLLLFHLKARGLGSGLSGLFLAANWLGVLLLTPWAARLVQRLGTGRALVLSGVVPVITTAGIQFSPWVPLWALLSLLGGMSGALRWVLSESLIARLAPPHRRGRMMGLFSTLIGATFMLGPALLAGLLSAGWTLPQIGWVVWALLVLNLLLLVGIQAPNLGDAPATGAAPARPGLWAAVRAAPVVMVTGLVGGFFEAGLSGALPLWGMALGWTEATAALLVTLSGLGSTLAAAPVGELADRFPRARLRRIAVALCLAGALLVPWVVLPGWQWLVWPVVMAWGAAGAGLYTLAMTDIGHLHADHGHGPALVQATAVLVLAYTVGGLASPVLVGLALEHAPRFGLAAVLALVAVAGFWRPGAGAGRAWRRPHRLR